MELKICLFVYVREAFCLSDSDEIENCFLFFFLLLETEGKKSENSMMMIERKLIYNRHPPHRQFYLLSNFCPNMHTQNKKKKTYKEMENYKIIIAFNIFILFFFLHAWMPIILLALFPIPFFISFNIYIWLVMFIL